MPKDDSETESLYDRIGGKEVVEDLVGEFYGRVLGDSLLAPFFEHTPSEKLSRMQEELFTEALGGPLSYTGRPLSEAHEGRGIKHEHFQRFIEHLLATLGSFNLTDDEIHSVLSRVGLDASDIVGESNVDG